MDTKKIIEELKEIKDLRTRQANELRNKFIELVEEFKTILDNTRFERCDRMVRLAFYDYGNPGGEDDEELVIAYKDGEICLLNRERFYDYDAGELRWVSTDCGEFSEEIKKDWKEVVTNKIAFDKIEQLIENIKNIVEDERRYIERQANKIEKAEKFLSSI